MLEEKDLDVRVVQSIARRIGYDGLLLIGDSKKADVRVRLFEKDGTESNLCGNGILCVAYHLSRIHRSRKWSIEMDFRVHLATVRRDRVTARFGRLGTPFHFVSPGASCVSSHERVLEFKHCDETLHFVNSGEPHLFLFAPDVSGVDINKYMGLISDSKVFTNGTNFSILTRNIPWRIRTFERGVRIVTGSCGTGSVAAAQLLNILGYTDHRDFRFLSTGGIHEVTLDDDYVYLGGRVAKNEPFLISGNMKNLVERSGR